MSEGSVEPPKPSEPQDFSPQLQGIAGLVDKILDLDLKNIGSLKPNPDLLKEAIFQSGNSDVFIQWRPSKTINKDDRPGEARTITISQVDEKGELEEEQLTIYFEEGKKLRGNLSQTTIKIVDGYEDGRIVLPSTLTLDTLGDFQEILSIRLSELEHSSQSQS